MTEQTEDPIRVAVVEDDLRILNLIAEVLSSAIGYECVGQYRDGTSACANLTKTQPNVILMDVNLPDFSGVECVARISKELPDSQILMLTSYQDPDTIFEALTSGAHGYLVKPVLPKRLLGAIQEIRDGGVPMSRTIARKVIHYFHKSEGPPSCSPKNDDSLAPREQQVIEYLMTGLSYKEIASKLNIGVSTVGTYVQRIYEKLHVRSRREIIAHYNSEK